MTIRKKLVKQQELPHTSSQYGELRPTSGYLLASLGHRSKFQRVSRLGSVTTFLVLLLFERFYIYKSGVSEVVCKSTRFLTESHGTSRPSPRRQLASAAAAAAADLSTSRLISTQTSITVMTSHDNSRRSRPNSISTTHCMTTGAAGRCRPASNSHTPQSRHHGTASIDHRLLRYTYLLNTDVVYRPIMAAVFHCVRVALCPRP